MHTIKYKRYPNNEVRAVHYYRAPQKTVNDEEEGAESKGAASSTSPSPEAEEVPCPVSPLDISGEVSERGNRSDRKRTKFGAVAKNTLLRAGGALDTVCSKPHHYVMLTGTLPGGTPEAMQCIANESSWIVKQLSDWFRKTYPTEYWFYVWELQKRGALHIHWCVYLPDTYQRCKLLWSWWDKWYSILQHIQEKTGVDLWRRKDGTYHHAGHSVLQADAQQVYTSVAAYLSGYCSNDKDKHARDAYSPYYPSRWWGYSRPLKKLLDSLTETLIVQHNNFRAARYEMLTHYERVLHDSPKAHHYPHKVGIGSTVVSYHPEDKAEKTWQTLRTMLYKPQAYPKCSFMIATYRRLYQETTYFLEACPKQLNPFSKPLLLILKGVIFSAAGRGYTFSRKDLTVALSIDCTLSSPLTTHPDWERLRRSWCLLQDSLKKHLPKMKWDRFGFLSNTDEDFGLLDSHWSSRYLSTTDPEGEGDVQGSGTRVFESTKLPLFPNL